jgi:hypothetical protein
MPEANNAGMEFHCEPKSRPRHRATSWPDDGAKAEPMPTRTVQMGAKLSSKSAPQEAILASIKEELMHRLHLVFDLLASNPLRNSIHAETSSRIVPPLSARGPSQNLLEPHPPQ